MSVRQSRQRCLLNLYIPQTFMDATRRVHPSHANAEPCRSINQCVDGEKCEWESFRLKCEDGSKTAQTIFSRQKLMFTLKIICFLETICIIMCIPVPDDQLAHRSCSNHVVLFTRRHLGKVENSPVRHVYLLALAHVN